MDESILKNVIRSFTNEPADDVRMLEGGHINRSFLVYGKERYILQNLKKDLFGDRTDAIENNYILYKTACEEAKEETGNWSCPEWMEDRGGLFFHRDETGGIWRMYRYIECKDDPLKTDVSALGEGLGKMHRILAHCDVNAVKAPLPHIYDLSYYYEEYRKITDCANSEEITDPIRDKEIESIIEQKIERYLSLFLPGKDVIHADAKAGNMIVNDGVVTGFIDLDTMMPGSLYDDIADCLRSCTTGKEGKIDSERVKAFLAGYEKGSNKKLSDDDRNLIKENLGKNMFMLGLRYYTDHISGGGYFAEAHPGQNLDKAHKLFDKYKSR